MMPQAIGNDVIIHPIYPDEKIGSIHTPESIVKRRENQGIITNIGPAVSSDYINDKDELTELQTGDHVLFNAYSGDKIKSPLTVVICTSGLN